MSDEPAKSKTAWRIACVAAFIFLGVLIVEIAVWARMAGSPEADVDSEHQKMLAPIVHPDGKTLTSGDTWCSHP